MTNLIGKKVFITDKDSMYGEWGIVKDFDGEYYHIAIANGTDSMPIFRRNEFRVPRERKVKPNDRCRTQCKEEIP